LCGRHWIAGLKLVLHQVILVGRKPRRKGANRKGGTL
jgi:hypothetical protein